MYQSESLQSWISIPMHRPSLSLCPCTSALFVQERADAQRGHYERNV